MVQNDYIPFASEILKVVKHTPEEYTFRMAYQGGEVTPGQFFEVSIPKYENSNPFRYQRRPKGQ